MRNSQLRADGGDGKALFINQFIFAFKMISTLRVKFSLMVFNTSSSSQAFIH